MGLIERLIMLKIKDIYFDNASGRFLAYLRMYSVTKTCVFKVEISVAADLFVWGKLWYFLIYCILIAVSRFC